MKTIRHLIVAAALGCGLVSCAQAHVFVGVGFAAPVYPVMPVIAPAPVYATAPVYAAPPPAYYAPPPVVTGYYYGHPYGYGYARHYGCWNCGYAYWAR
ncbi:hypothetical protein [Caballeronia sp. dw_19]|jgi:hypothetical protein|uniref:hypothetical protein n=1 Tax=unclassified Caballeronia TaxID=2646786 RepID=UPI001BD2BB44|nr:hypothetical protein [Caballeronia sp. dw_19]